jgi:hypothetical protein
MKTLVNSISLWLLIMCASLSLAYWASIPKGADAGQRATQNLVVDSMERVELSLGGRTVEASRENKTSFRWWIVNNTVDAPEGVVQDPSGDKSRFLASDKFMDYLRLMSTFPVLREIGAIASDKLNSFGLDAPSGSIVVKSASGVMVEFSLGKQPYGARSYYVMRASDKKVFLVAADVIDDFLKPEARFFERRVSLDALELAQSIAITMDGKTKTFIRLNPSDGRTSQWAEKGSQTPVPAIGTWLDKFSEIRAASYVDDEVRTSLSSRPPNLSVQSIDKKGNSHSVALFMISASDKAEYFVMSDFLGWPAKVASARSENVLKDAQLFFQN